MLTPSPTTWGAPEFRDNIATADSAVVRKYRAAGAVVFGKTNVPLMLGVDDARVKAEGEHMIPIEIGELDDPKGIVIGMGGGAQDAWLRVQASDRLDQHPDCICRNLRAAAPVSVNTALDPLVDPDRVADADPTIG